LTRPDGVSVWGPTREFWVFNPGPRLDICLEEGIYDFVFHQKTYQFKSNMAIDPQRHLTLLAENYPWRAMLIDYHEELALLYTNEKGWRRPAGVFPMWSAATKTDKLRKILDNYPQPDEEVGWFTGAPVAAKAIKGQEQRIVVCNFPKHMVAWENVFRDLMDAKRDYPHITFHANGQKTMARTLGVGIDSFDHPVTIDWIGDQPRLLMASGRLLNEEQYRKGGEHEKWARLVGMRAGEIFDQPDRVRKSRRMYKFNLRSLKWAFSNYEQVWSMRIVDETDVNVDDPDSSWAPVDLQYRPRAKDINDKWLCDLCSISNRCPYFKPGAICIVDDTEAANLAKNFKSRNANDILNGLGVLVAAQTQRTHEAMKAEKYHNDNDPNNPRFSPEVTRMLAHVFDQGVTLARLIDPFLGVAAARGGNSRARAIPATATSVAGATPQELAAGMMKELERAGKDITQLSADEAREFLARIVPSGTIPPHVDEDAPPVEPGGGSHVAPPAPGFRAAPSFHPGVFGAEVPGPDGDDP
jgi:hypothetical protein